MIELLVAVGVIGVLLAMLLAPLEALGWWAGWYGEGLAEPDSEGPAPYTEVGPSTSPRHYVIFLDGIAKVGADNYENVQDFLDDLSERLEDTVVLGDIMPYSPLNRALTEDRLLAPFWRYAFRLKLEGKRPLLTFSINLRNFLQVLVAADGRYGAIYGQGEAQVMLNSLLRAGYVPGSGTPITLIGYSGGAQIAQLSAPFLRRALNAPVSLISLGGVISSGRGLGDLDDFYQLQGSRDVVARLGQIFFPGRWPIFPHTHWNRLRRRGLPVRVDMGPMRHHQSGGYLDDDALHGDSDHRTMTVEVIEGLLRRIGERTGRSVTETLPEAAVG